MHEDSLFSTDRWAFDSSAGEFLDLEPPVAEPGASEASSSAPFDPAAFGYEPWDEDDPELWGEPVSAGVGAPGPTPSRSAQQKLGRAVLRLRLFMRWTQAELERASGVDQTTISRFERGESGGLMTVRLAAMLDALHVSDVVFDKPPTVPQTDLDRMIYGDPWRRACIEADRRLGWPGSGHSPPRRRKRARREPGLRYRRDP